MIFCLFKTRIPSLSVKWLLKMDGTFKAGIVVQWRVVHKETMSYLVWALASVLMTTDFPPPVGPTTMVVCLVNIVSYNWTTLSA